MLGNSTNARSIQYASGSFDDLLSLQSFFMFFLKKRVGWPAGAFFLKDAAIREANGGKLATPETAGVYGNQIGAVDEPSIDQCPKHMVWSQSNLCLYSNQGTNLWGSAGPFF